MRRRRHQAPNTQQKSLFAKVVEPAGAATGEAVPRSRAARFQDDCGEHLYLGDERLDAYLQRQGLKWIVRLRRELRDLDYGRLKEGYAGRGRPPYHPRTMVGLIVYGILTGHSSLRGLEELARRDLGAWWVCGGLQPDHSTIGDFICSHAEVLSEFFATAVVQALVKRAGLKAGLVAGDGTVVESAASRYGVLRREALQEEAAKAQQAAEARPEDSELRKKADKLNTASAAAEERSERREHKGRDGAEVRVTPEDPDAVVQPRKDKVYRPSYKPSMLVHESGLIVGQALDASSETAVVEDLLDQHREVFGSEPKTALFDAGYNGGAVLKMMCERGIDVLCPSGKVINGEWEKQESAKQFGKQAFEYDADSDVYRCPAGELLRREHRSSDGDGRAYTRYQAPGQSCASCELRQQCTSGKRGRTVKRYDGEEYREAAAEVLRQPAARAVYRKRMPLAERPNAELRERLGLRRFRRVGLAGVRVEFALHVIALNLKWAVLHIHIDDPSHYLASSIAHIVLLRPPSASGALVGCIVVISARIP